jgi:hypothetical protein
MFEDAPVNTGAVQWPDADSAFWTVRRMQIKLHRWASEDHTRRFGDLLNLGYDPAFLVHAWERVSSNAGARTPGVDRATVARIVSRVGVEVFLGQIRDSLKSGGFAPVEVRRVMIPTASGKVRRLGIPTVADRVVQASLKAVLEPIFEADFIRFSGGGCTALHRERADNPRSVAETPALADDAAQISPARPYRHKARACPYGTQGSWLQLSEALTVPDIDSFGHHVRLRADIGVQRAPTQPVA